MDQIFPYLKIITAILILIVGFLFHWVGQLTSIINWKFATKIGLQESNMPREYKVYEHAIAAADSIVGWVYGLAAIGLLLNSSFGYKLSLFTGGILIYHSLSFWFWTKNRNADGNKLESNSMRITWTIINFTTGALAIILGWIGS